MVRAMRRLFRYRHAANRICKIAAPIVVGCTVVMMAVIMIGVLLNHDSLQHQYLNDRADRIRILGAKGKGLSINHAIWRPPICSECRAEPDYIFVISE